MAAKSANRTKSTEEQTSKSKAGSKSTNASGRTKKTKAPVKPKKAPNTTKTVRLSQQLQDTLEELGQETAVDMLRKMVLIRRFEERTTEMYQQRKIGGFCHLYIGQEAIAVGTAWAKRTDDYLVTSYRDHGFALALDMTPNECMAEMFGKITGCARGKGGSMHFFSKEKNFLGGHGIVGGQIPIGTGAGFRAKYLGTEQVSLTFFGEGANSQGSFHEAVNLASIWNLPCIYVIENNKYGMGTDVSRVVAIEELHQRAAAFSMEGLSMNGMDVFECYRVMKEEITKCRKTSRPILIEAKTYRFRGHSVSDPGKYRSKIELEAYKHTDPIIGARLTLAEMDWLNDDEFKEIDKAVKAEVIQSVKYADESPLPGMEELKRHVYYEG